MQVDGEPWIQAPGQIIVLRSALKVMITLLTSKPYHIRRAVRKKTLIRSFLYAYHFVFICGNVKGLINSMQALFSGSNNFCDTRFPPLPSTPVSNGDLQQMAWCLCGLFKFALLDVPSCAQGSDNIGENFVHPINLIES